MPALADLDVLVIDCQTTGASPAFGSVLELGWGVTRASEPARMRAEAHWIALPGDPPVSRRVQQITGYQPAFRDQAIADSDAWQRLRRAVEHAPRVPTVIHYARFELSFLREWSARLEPDRPFALDAVCVHAIARRLYPELPRQSLRALAGFLGHSLDLARRSLGHVEATAFVWHKLCEELGRREITEWEQLPAWLSDPGPRLVRPKKPTYPIAAEKYRSLPDAPGVYRFLRSNGDVLYVGKAASLKKRTASHFLGRAGTAQSPEMLTQVSEIEVTVVASALEAALLENETIKTRKPPYNVQLTAGDPRVWYASRDFARAVSSPDELHPHGPVASESSLRPLGALTALIAGAAPTVELRASAVGVSDLWTPDEAVFVAGWAELLLRHAADLAGSPDTARPRTLRLARKLLLAGALTRGSDDEEGEEAEKPDGWDPERVARHVERAAAQAFQAYRRARWLSLLADSVVVYAEPAATRVRRLRVQGGEVVEAADATGETWDMGVPRVARGVVFDRGIYDRLRILTSELKRIVRDGGRVTIFGRSGRQLPDALLAGALRLV